MHPLSTIFPRRLVLSLLSVFLLVPATYAAPTNASLPLHDDALVTQARALPVQGRLFLTDVDLDSGQLQNLELRRIRVFSPDATLQVRRDGADVALAIPDTAYFTGRVQGEPGSRATLSVRDGDASGLIISSTGHWMISSDPESENTSRVGELTTRRLDADRPVTDDGEQGFACGNHRFDSSGSALPTTAFADAILDNVRAKGGGSANTARVAIETDFEYLQNRFGGNTQEALDYLGDVFAFASGVYEDEVDTTLEITHTQLWAQSNDPWSQTNAGCGLLEFGKYWNEENSGIDRTIAHFVSGKSGLSGIAWVGVLCRGPFSFDPALLNCPASINGQNGGDYGYTKGVSGSFNPGGSPQLWDTIAITHEIGHNFDSPHTHCYGGLGGSVDTIDECSAVECGNSGCYCGATSLPSGCPGNGQSCGTIMSYCHLLSGGFGNIAPSFGQNHPYGVAPDRVPTRMRTHVTLRDTLNPGCLDYFEADMVFTDGFESGNANAWSQQVP